MLEQTKIAKVWHIENNELNCKNKKVVSINFNDIEISILKEEKDFYAQDFLIKDKNNEYWKLGIAPIKFQLFVDNEVIENEEQTRIEEYKKDITNAYKNIDLKGFWQKKIEQNKYFNKCELEYIHRNFPEIYEQAKESRRTFEENRDREQEQERQEQERKEQEKIKAVNDRFKKALKEMKYKIFIGEMVSVEDFEFYKDDKYSGRTIQNNILYLAKIYGIKIPLATQGFINNRLKSYNFKTRDCFYKITDENKRCSTKMGIYLEQIYQKIQEEYKESFKRKMKLVPEKSMER